MNKKSGMVLNNQKLSAMERTNEKVKDVNTVNENEKAAEKLTFNDLLIQSGGFGRWNWILLGFCYIRW